MITGDLGEPEYGGVPGTAARKARRGPLHSPSRQSKSCPNQTHHSAAAASSPKPSQFGRALREKVSITGRWVECGFR